ncbi:MAG: hypothetical protein PHX28_03175 [Candidatus Omnitrophica bacterium]|nr:hypothetical protein [Candidatus Omnitrophota bacterium]MDD3275265.1 hypothetical protein [Candidatus Omnitrophota bacterium]MDD5725133.1 hypothetical protein [Candidatus Omnitrophota bacterium]
MLSKKRALKKIYGQSTLEYVIILAVVIGAIVAVATMFKSDITVIYDLAYK